MKTVTKVKVEKYTPKRWIFHEVLRPGYNPGVEFLIVNIINMFGVKRVVAERAVYSALDIIETHDITYRDRARLGLPDIKDRYPEILE